MKQWVQKYSGILRNLRPTYWLYNLTNLQQLKKNKALYKQFGVEKPIWQSIAHADIKKNSTDLPWMDNPNITEEQIKAHPSFNKFDAVTQQQLLLWPKQGYLIIPGLFAQKADAINAEIERLKTDKTIDFNFTGKKIMDAWQYSSLLNDVFKDERILNILSFIFQTSNEPLNVFKAI